jgi:hypothetical protein
LVPATSLEMGRSKVHPVIFSLLWEGNEISET